MKSFKNKVIWITGGKRIGQKIAVAFAMSGANLVITYRSSKKEAQEIARRVKKYKTKVFIVRCDVGDRGSVAGVAKEIKKKFGKFDVLILLASIFKPVKLGDIDEKSLDENFSAHVKGTFWPIQLSLKLMPRGSHIITVSDRTALGRIYPGYFSYVMTKSAVAAMTRALAVELGPKGVFINSIAPGPVLRPSDLSEREWRKIRSGSLVKYPITDKEAVQEFVDTVLRLSSVRSTGGIYPLDFGHL